MNGTFQQAKFRYANETVGLFVLISFVIFFAGLIYSGQVREWFNPGQTLRVVLPDDGLFGLAQGSIVEILGTEAGQVQDIVIDPSQKMHADVRIDREMAVFIRSDSMATIRRTFGIAGDAYLEISRGVGQPLDWNYAVITAVSDRKPTDTVGELIDEIRAKVFPVIGDAQKAIGAFLAVAEELQDPNKGVQKMLANLILISDRINGGEGTIGRLLTEDQLVKDLETLIAQMNTGTQRVGPILDELNRAAQNVAEFSGQINAKSKDIRESIQSLKETLAAAEKVMKDLSQTTPQLPRIAKNIGETTDTVPILVLQVERVMLELEQLIKQLQSHWLIGGGSREPTHSATRISPLEVSP